MPLPAAYTEETLAQFMHTVLGPVASTMDYVTPEGDAGDYAEAVNETLLAYDISDIADATDIKKVRVLARREAWRKVMDETAGHYDVSADDASYKRSQLHEQAKANFEQAATEAAQYDSADFSVGIVELTYSDTVGSSTSDE